MELITFEQLEQKTKDQIQDQKKSITEIYTGLIKKTNRHFKLDDLTFKEQQLAETAGANIAIINEFLKTNR